MARGWESKSVEDQITEAEAKAQVRARRQLTESQIEQQKRKEALLIERARIEREMLQGHKRRYLMLLERSLAHVESELAKLEQS